MIEVAKPYFEKKERVRPCPQEYIALKRPPVEKDINPYEIILAREARNWFEKSQMIGIVHLNSMPGEVFFNFAVALHKNGMKIRKYGRSLLEKALENSKFETLMPLNRNQFFSTGFIFSTEHKNVNLIMKSAAKFPQVQLLCGIVEDKLLSRNEFIEYGKMPDIKIVQAQFANTLNLAANQLVQNLQCHQSNLVNLLDAHVQANSKEDEKPKE